MIRITKLERRHILDTLEQLQDELEAIDQSTQYPVNNALFEDLVESIEILEKLQEEEE